MTPAEMKDLMEELKEERRTINKTLDDLRLKQREEGLLKLKADATAALEGAKVLLDTVSNKYGIKKNIIVRNINGAGNKNATALARLLISKYGLARQEATDLIILVNKYHDISVKIYNIEIGDIDGAIESEKDSEALKLKKRRNEITVKLLQIEAELNTL